MSTDRGMDEEDAVHIYSGILAIKENEIMLFAAIWMDLEIIILTEVKSEKDKYITHMWNLIFKNDTNELIYKTETDLQISKTNLLLPKGKRGMAGRDKSGAWDEHTHTTVYKIDNQQGPTIAQGTLLNIL